MDRLPSVLFVNNQADDFQMYLDYLHSANLASVAVCAASEAREQAIARIADVIVTDLVVPFGNGIDLIRSLRLDDRTRAIGIIVVSAKVRAKDHTRAKNAGCDTFLQKPCLPEVLLREIERATAIARGRSTIGR